MFTYWLTLCLKKIEGVSVIKFTNYLGTDEIHGEGSTSVRTNN